LSPRPDVSEERKQQILQAAMAVFARLGLSEARMDDIVEESGLSKGALYWYFDSKDAIIGAILDSMFEREFADLKPILGGDGTVSERLYQFMDYTMKEVKRMFSLLPLAYEFYALAFRQKVVRQAIEKYFRQYVALLEPAIQEGIQQGEFRQVDAKDAVMALGAIVEGTILLWVYDAKAVDLEHHGKASLQLLLDGLKADAS
jgi:AcrR family transcriptional regulator